MPTINTTNIAVQLLDFKTKYTNRYTENYLKKHVIIIFIRINQSQIIMYTNECQLSFNVNIMSTSLIMSTSFL
jgi:hypothetical protein